MFQFWTRDNPTTTGAPTLRSIGTDRRVTPTSGTPASRDGDDGDDPLALDRHIAQLTACERQLRRAGMPVLIADYSAAEDIFTRARPLLMLVVLFEMSGALNDDWSVAANIGAVAGSGVLLVGMYGLFNWLRGRYFTARPHRVSVAELAAFVVLPSLLPLVFGGQWFSALVTALINVAVLLLVWLVVGFGMLSIVRWAGQRLFMQIAASPTLLVRALPLILFFGLLAFFTTELWQLFDSVPTARLVALYGFFILLGLTFLSIRLPRSVREVEESVDLAGVPLRRGQRVNLALVILVSQSLQIMLVTATVWLFFAVSGALLVDVSVIESWTGGFDEVFDVNLFGEEVVVTVELIRAAFGIAAFSSLYYTVGMMVDATYRDEFVAELIDQMRSTFVVRTEYLQLQQQPLPRTVEVTGADS